MKWIRPSKHQIESWIRQNFINHKTRSHGRDGLLYLVNNPFDASDTKHHLAISAEKGWVHDFRPDYDDINGSFVKFVSKYRRCSFNEAVKEICGDDSLQAMMDTALFNIKNKKLEDKAETNSTLKLPPNMLGIANDSRKSAWQLTVNYLSKRKVTIEEAENRGVLYNAIAVCFPYYEYGELVCWQSREILNKRFEFPSSETGVIAADFLYGFDLAQPYGVLLITEAIFDSIAVGEGCVATGGAMLSEQQIRRIKLLNPSKIILIPDNDRAGKQSIEKNFYALERHKQFKNKVHMCLPPDPHKDWNAMAQHGKIVIDYINSNTKKINRFSVKRLLKT